MSNKKDRLSISEIFMATAGGDFNRCFHGTIKRLVDAYGKPYVFGKIKVNEGYIVAQAQNQWELGERLDELVLMVLDYDIYNIEGKHFWIKNYPKMN